MSQTTHRIFSIAFTATAPLCTLAATVLAEAAVVAEDVSRLLVG